MITNWFPEKYSAVEEKHFILENCFQEVVEGTPFLHFFRYNPFLKAFRLQIHWESGQAQVTKSTLISEGRIRLESGKLSLSDSANLLGNIQNLKVSMLDLMAPEANARDGSIFELSVGCNDAKLNFQWWNADTPVAWTALDELAVNILKLEAEIAYSPMVILAYSLEKEAKFATFGQSKSLFIDYKTVEE